MDKEYIKIEIKKSKILKGIKTPLTLFLRTNANRTQQKTTDNTFEVLTKREYLRSTSNRKD